MTPTLEDKIRGIILNSMKEWTSGLDDGTRYDMASKSTGKILEIFAANGHPDDHTVTHVHKDENRCTSSLSIGTESKGGQVKVYFNPDDPEDMLDKIDVAMVGKGYAANILAASVAGATGAHFINGTIMAKKSEHLVGEHAKRVDKGEWKNKRPAH